MSRRKLACAVVAVTLMSAAPALHAQQRISEDRDLLEIDLTGWDCLDRPGGAAKTEDGVERNRGKNRGPIDLARLTIPKFDTPGFLRHVGEFDAQTKGKRRKDLNDPEREQLAALEKQIVSLTAYLVIAYAGPPESTNCSSIDFHDWHLELFEQPLDHAPGVGDPTPIVCETTPRTQSALFRDGVRLQKLAGFFRRPDLESETLGQKPQRVRITGYLLWDDDHNGSADIGTTIQKVGRKKYHQPWRSTPWEIHPVLKIELADGTSSSSTGPRPPAINTLQPTAVPSPAPVAPPEPEEVTIVEPVTIKVRYGETMLQRGTKLPIVSRDAKTVTVKYMGETLALPLQSTDLR